MYCSLLPRILKFFYIYVHLIKAFKGMAGSFGIILHVYVHVCTVCACTIYVEIFAGV